MTTEPDNLAACIGLLLMTFGIACIAIHVYRAERRRIRGFDAYVQGQRKKHAEFNRWKGIGEP